MCKVEARHVDVTQAPAANANGSRPAPIGANFSLHSIPYPPSSRKPVCPKSSISLAKRAIRDPLAPAIHEDPGSCAAAANGSRLTDFSSQVEHPGSGSGTNLEKSRVRDDAVGKSLK